MQSYIIRYSLLGFVLWLTIFLTTFITIDKVNPDFGLAEKIGYLAIIAFVAFMIPAQVKYAKEQTPAGFGQLFKLGFFITLVASVLVAAADTIYTQVFYPEFMDEYSKWSINELKANNASEADIERFKEEMKGMPTGPGFMFIIMFFTVLPIGTVLSLVSSAVLSKLNSKA